MEVLCDLLVHKAGLTKNHLALLLNVMQYKTLQQKDFFVKEGTVCNQIGFIKTGVLRSFVYGNKEEHNTDFYFQNYFVSAYSSFVTQLPTEHSIQALTVSEVYYLTLQDYNELVSKDAEWLRLGKYIADFFLIRKCKREISFLKQTASERLESMLATYPGIEQMVPQYHIASYLGIKPESLSRLKQSDYLQNKKLLLQ